MANEVTKATGAQVAIRSEVGQAANRAASSNAFRDFLMRKAENTQTIYMINLDTFADFLNDVGASRCTGLDLALRPETWTGITWGLVETFVKWMLNQGYAIATINNKLSTVKNYAKLAAKAGTLDPTEAQMIRNVSGYSMREGKRVDQQRPQTRMSNKKEEPVRISVGQARRLKQGWHRAGKQLAGARDAVITTLLLDHGLRAGELCDLRIENFDMHGGVFTFYRQKVDKTQAHRMTEDSYVAVERWLKMLGRTRGLLLWGVTRGDTLNKEGMTQVAVLNRLRILGERVELENLSAHDCRHYWASRAAKNKTSPFALRDAGGWNTLAMPSRYVAESDISNEDVILD